jgi:site-specific recombinase XerD
MWDEARQWEEPLRAAGKLQARTITLYGQDVRRFLAWFAWRVPKREVEQERAQHREHRDLGTATPEEALAYRVYLLEQGLGRSAVNRALTSLRLFFAMRSEPSPEAVPNPFRDIPTVPRPPRDA